MTNFVYNTGIPAANNNPSTDQPDMLTNTNSTNSILNVDHFTFNNNNGGMHQQVQMVSRNTIPPGTNNTPVGLKAGAGTLYTKPLGGPSNLFFTPDQSGNEYQLTRINSAGFARFGTFTVDPAPPAVTISTYGWTFLPGGLLMQYGTVTGSGGASTLPNTATVNFPVAFTTGVFSINITIRRNNPTDNFFAITRTTPPTTTTFTYTIVPSGGSVDALYWQAIGN